MTSVAFPFYALQEQLILLLFILFGKCCNFLSAIRTMTVSYLPPDVSSVGSHYQYSFLLWTKYSILFLQLIIKGNN